MFDASGEGLSEELLRNMSETKKSIAFNVAGCEAEPSHGFLTIGGECADCHPLNIPFAVRENKTGYLYIAGSKRGELMLVGSVNEIKDRVTINAGAFRYGGFDDWELLYHAKTDTLGRAERLVQAKLNDYRAAYQYEKPGKIQNGGELYRCAYQKAKDTVTALQQDGEFSFSQENEKKHLLMEYHFKNLVVKSVAAK